MLWLIWFHSVYSQTENDFSDICYKLFSFFFLYHFWPVLYTVVNYQNTWFTRSFLALSAYKCNKIYNKIQNIWFPLSTYSLLQLPKQCIDTCICYVFTEPKQSSDLNTRNKFYSRYKTSYCDACYYCTYSWNVIVLCMSQNLAFCLFSFIFAY